MPECWGCRKSGKHDSAWPGHSLRKRYCFAWRETGSFPCLGKAGRDSGTCRFPGLLCAGDPPDSGRTCHNHADLPNSVSGKQDGDFGPAHEIAFRDRVTFTVEPFSMYGRGAEMLPQQLLKKKMLVYGNSLSQGMSSHLAIGAYPWLPGRRLGYDVYNYALAGCCPIEQETVDFLTGFPEKFDLILVEPSTNLFARGFSTAEFERRCRRFLDTMTACHPGVPIQCLNLFPSLFDCGFTGGELSVLPGKAGCCRFILPTRACVPCADQGAAGVAKFFGGSDASDVRRLLSDCRPVSAGTDFSGHCGKGG